MTVAAFDAETTGGTLNPGARGAVYLSNGIYTCVWTGSAWEYYHAGQRAYRPKDSDFAWLNQSTSTVDTSSGGIYLLQPSAATQYLAIRKRAAPATPYTVTVKIQPNLFPSVQNIGVGMLIGNGTAQHTFGVVIIASNGFNVITEKWTSPSVWSAIYTSVAYDNMGWQTLWMRMQDNGTNRICSLSVDGYNFRVLHTVARTDFLTGTEIGFYAKAQNGAEAAGVMLVSWQVT